MKRILTALCFSLLWATTAFANVPCTLPFTLVNGTVADASQVMSNYNALVSCLGNAALAGANADITSLSALTTPIPPLEGGTTTFLGGTSTGSANAQVVASTTPANFTLTNAYKVRFKAGFTNTGPTTLNVNALGAINVFKISGTGPIALQGGELVTGQDVEVIYDGTQYELASALVRVVGGVLPTSGSCLTFYNPTCSASAATGQIVKVGRLQVDLESLQGTQFPQSPTSWPVSFEGIAATENASIDVVSTIGGNGIHAASRTSDYRTAFGVASPAAQGGVFFALNDDTVSASPITCAMCSVSWRASGVGGNTQGAQIDINNAGTVVDTDPVNTYPSGSTVALNITAGAYLNTLNNASEAIAFGQGQNAKFRKGLLFNQNALDATVGAGGGGVAADMFTGMSYRWKNGSGTIVGEMWGGSLGMALSAFGIGTGAGYGGAVTQTTSIGTTVTINKISGTITTVSNSFVGGSIVGFQVNNSLVNAGDVIIISQQHIPSGNGYLTSAANVFNGGFQLEIDPLTNATESLLLNFVVVHSSTN